MGPCRTCILASRRGMAGAGPCIGHDAAGWHPKANRASLGHPSTRTDRLSTRLAGKYWDGYRTGDLPQPPGTLLDHDELLRHIDAVKLRPLQALNCLGQFEFVIVVERHRHRHGFAPLLAVDDLRPMRLR